MKILREPILKEAQIDTPIGPMLAIAHDEVLLFLEFIDSQKITRKIGRLKERTQSVIVKGKNALISSIEQELSAWFDGSLNVFQTPVLLQGSDFQNDAWEALRLIPYGETRSYLEQASVIGRPSACRAIANANGANQLAIIIPCHRIINHNGQLGGYAGGLARKQWLLDHEKHHQKRL